MRNIKTNKFVIELRRPVCRTPIKPVQAHKNAVKYSRRVKHINKPVEA
mgnify:CR=1 FL=1